VPTWNYASVHAYGPARRIDDPVWLRDLVRRLSERHEAREPAPWSMEGLPEIYVQSMLKGIVGIEIAVNRLEGKFKLSQNRPAADRPRIIAALKRRADPDSHAAEKRWIDDEFSGQLRAMFSLEARANIERCLGSQRYYAFDSGVTLFDLEPKQAFVILQNVQVMARTF